MKFRATAIISALIIGVLSSNASAQTPDPNVLFVEALRIFEEADESTGPERSQKLQEVRDKFDQIVAIAPDSPQGKAILEGGIVAGVDIQLLPQSSSAFPKVTYNSMTGLLDSSDIDGMIGFITQTFPTTIGTLQQFQQLNGAEKAVAIRGTYFMAVFGSYLSDNVGNFLAPMFSPAEFEEAVSKYIKGGPSAAGINLVTDAAADLAKSYAVEFAASVMTDAVMTALPDTTSDLLEAILRAALKTTLIETFDALEIAFKRDPWLLVGKFVDRFEDVREVIKATNALSRAQDQGLIQVAIGVETAAYLVTEVPTAKSRAVASDHLKTLHSLLPSIVGPDDAKQVSMIVNVGYAALRAAFEGNTERARELTKLIHSLGNQSNISWIALFENPQDWLLAASNWGDDAPERAASIMIGATALADPSRALVSRSASSTLSEPKADDGIWSFSNLSNGSIFDDRSLSGELSFFVLGYISDPDITPNLLLKADNFLASYDGSGRPMSWYFLSVDPERDSQAGVSRYLNLTAPNLTGLYGNKASIESFLRQYRVRSSRQQSSGGFYLIDISPAGILFDQNGRVVSKFNSQQLIQEIANLSSLTTSTQPAAPAASVQAQPQETLPSTSNTTTGFTAGCTGCFPKAQHAQHAFGNLLNQIVDTPVVISRFAKTNGVRGNVGGVETYELQFQATVDFPQGILARKGGLPFIVAPSVMEKMTDLKLLMNYRSTRGAGMPAGSGRTSYADVPTTVVGSGVVSFRKTEAGWQAYDGVVYGR